MKRESRQRRGIALVWVGMLMIVFIGLVGLALDTGLGVLTAYELGNTADAAALAGARHLKFGPDLPRLHAYDVAYQNEAALDPVQLILNEGNAAGGDIVLGRYNRQLRTFNPTLEAPNSVQVNARRSDTSLNGPLSLIFGPHFGVDTINVERTAIAINQGGTGAGIIALCESCRCSLRVTGTGSVTVRGGPIQVNSDRNCSTCGNGTPTIDTIGINTGGGFCDNGSGDYPDDIWEEAPPMGDPLAALPEPTWDPAADLGSITDSGTYGPGYYSGGINVSSADVTLLPGIYILDGIGLDVSGSSALFAEGVMFYIPAGTGRVDLTGTGSVYITPPDPALHTFAGATTYAGMSFFQSRENTNDSRIIGTSDLEIQGTLYFPTSPMELGGTGGTYGTQLIAYTAWIHGTGELKMNYDGRNPGLGHEVFLVE